MSKLDIQQWLSNLAETAQNKDFEKHMDLFSENLASYEKNTGQSHTYSEWRSRRENDFQSGLLKNIRYDNLSVKNIGLRRLTFRVEETTDNTDGAKVITKKEVILEHENDNQWRMVEETIKDRITN